MDKTYQPDKIESHWREQWQNLNTAATGSSSSTNYCIMLPPPNVTGTLHMGHGFQQSLMDALIRRAHMQGHNTLWQGGTDHAGIATQMVVERQLAKAGQSRHDVGREAFLERVWQWREQSGSTITNQIQRLGASIDWSRASFSLDDNIVQATQEAFIRLYEEGLIYRGKRLVNWDPALNTAISDLEVATVEKSGHLWHLRYPLTQQDGYLVVATTRPETLLGDVAVAVHPEDTRYQHLIGQTVTLPLANREIPIIADDYVDPSFGSGCVKITPAHDFNDYEMGLRHELPMITIFTLDAHLNDNETVPDSYRGLERYAARKQIVADIEAAGLLDKIEDYTVNLPMGDRSGVVVEPMLTDQWFVKAKPLAEAAMEAVTSGQLELIPTNWSKTYLQWLENIQDWCISRQLWWGHRIPVWYDNAGNHYAGRSEAEIRAKHQLADDIPLTQDNDVLDTWFTAALYPFSTLGWPGQTEDLTRFYPTDILVTGFDIIFYWVARMVMFGLKFMGDIPFRKVYITGLIRDHQGQKMSKTKGNVLDPIDLIDGIDLEPLIEKRQAGLIDTRQAEKIAKITRKEFPDGIAAHGTDALRFTFCALATTGRDINFDMGRMDGYRNFCNKLWNAARFVLMNTEGHELSDCEYSLADQWIQSELQKTVTIVNNNFELCRFDLLTQQLYDFTWHAYCDWYLELAKTVINDPDSSDALQRGARHTLLTVLETLLRLLHPIMPFITEEIWQRVAPLLNITASTLLHQSYPTASPATDDQENNNTLRSMGFIQKVILAIRNIRGEMQIKPNKKITLLLAKAEPQQREWITAGTLWIHALAKVDSITWLNPNDEIPASATAVVQPLEIHIPLAGLIDRDAELARMQKQIDKLRIEQTKSSKKLSNEGYVNKAPAEVVKKERDNLHNIEQELAQLLQNHERIKNI